MWKDWNDLIQTVVKRRSSDGCSQHPEAGLLCPMRLIANILMREKNGDGNRFFLQRATTQIAQPERNVDITCMNLCCRRL
jgi:hypothetical protein